MTEDRLWSWKSHHRSAPVWSASEGYSRKTELLPLAIPVHEVEVQEEVEAVVSAFPVSQASNHEVEVHIELVEAAWLLEGLEKASSLILPLSVVDKEQMQSAVEPLQLQ